MDSCGSLDSCHSSLDFDNEGIFGPQFNALDLMFQEDDVVQQEPEAYAPAVTPRTELMLQLDYDVVITAWEKMGGTSVRAPAMSCQNTDQAGAPAGASAVFLSCSSPSAQWSPAVPSDFEGSCVSELPEVKQAMPTEAPHPVMPLCKVEPSMLARCRLRGGLECESKRARAACVERYKEKKRNRAFSKTIRYEMRKINAQLRPRVKGRFVKRADTSLLEDFDEDGPSSPISQYSDDSYL